MECRQIKRLLTLALAATLIMADPLSVKAEEAAAGNADTTTEVEESDIGPEQKPEIEEDKVEKKVPVLSETLTLTPESTYYLDFREAGEKAKIEIISNQPNIVTVGRKGQLIPKECGSAVVQVNVKSGKKTQKTEFHVHVKYDRFYKVKNYGKAWKRTADSKAVKLYLHKQLIKGKTAAFI